MKNISAVNLVYWKFSLVYLFLVKKFNFQASKMPQRFFSLKNTKIPLKIFFVFFRGIFVFFRGDFNIIHFIIWKHTKYYKKKHLKRVKMQLNGLNWLHFPIWKMGLKRESKSVELYGYCVLNYSGEPEFKTYP